MPEKATRPVTSIKLSSFPLKSPEKLRSDLKKEDVDAINSHLSLPDFAR
ncbi:hypothetical protein NBRC3257_0890 [Gluconobacter thailandicus NBRC 3257]|uniref:Transposase n=1 Tax=Gluconobacter thailandicus NBRC 3257 TaxID=1381097 RepID=A0ABQ0IUM1_GLUTH|nr:hypothetical protein B932_0767 [Gluconobacter oxydans H24]GAC88293.1 hypothetical protein NBRC3255_1954 [Gluconobacter thailandicus NBRC 3255]GAD25891.1 hypothetical protein NBRC3257_0890 [Gluconobacter thailandicus NBRC 3257]